MPTVGSILVKHERVSCLGLCLENGVPELLRLDDALGAALRLVLEEELVELVSVDLCEARCLGRAEERPVAVLLDSAHEHVWNPERIKQVTRADLLLAVVLAQVEELEDVCVPRLNVDGKGSRSLVAALVDVARSVVVDSEHRDDTVRVALCE